MKKNIVKHFLLSIALIIFFCVNNHAQMPPHPKLLNKINRGEIAKPYTLSNLELIRSKGVDEPWSSIKLQTIKKQNVFSRTFGSAVVPKGSWKALVILVKFSDKPSQVNASHFDNILFSQSTGTLHDYYKKVSYGSLDIVTVNLPSSVGWVSAPQTYSYYVDGKNGMGSYPQNSQKLVEDIVNLIDPVIDFSKYDNDGDGYVDDLFIVHSGSGADYTGNNNDIWSHSWTTYAIPILDGVKIYHYSIEPEYWENPGDMTCGVFAHEMGHSVFGLPDLYDTDYSSFGLGNWSLMAGGEWNGILGNSPAFPDAWSHIQMGYLSPTIISTNISGQSIHNVENTPEAYLLQNSLCGTEYFLVENRQQTSYDTYLPGNGLCIYHVDNSVSNNNNEWYPGHTSSGHYRVALIQADGLWSLEHSSPGNSSDPYPGSSNNRNFSSISIPDSWNYNLYETGIGVSNISSSSSIMSADFKVDTQIQLPQFSAQLSIPLRNGGRTVAWGDYDNDGHLDILLTGANSALTGDWSIFSKIYRNNGDNTFTEQTKISLTGVYSSSAVWGDYNNDGYLDILLTGYTGSENVSKIYRNNGDNTFTEQTSISLTGISGKAAWGDYDNDGDLDILITGSSGQFSPTTKIYRNNYPENTFTEQTSISLTNISGTAAWGDYNNDGYLDILIMGVNSSQKSMTKIYCNNGDNTFTEQISLSLMGLQYGSAAWGDYDNDGYLDILLAGDNSTGSHFAKIYKNNGDNTFTEKTSINLIGTRYSTTTWADYDNDGYMDILITGFISLQKGSTSKIYHNNRDNTFTEQTSIHIFDMEGGAVAWGDYDNDGDLDLLRTGLWYNDDLSLIYRNNEAIKNTTPTIPSNLKVLINGNDVTFSWDKSSDKETPQNGLTYNLIIGTSPGTCDILSPMSDVNTGKRRIVSIGNAGHSNSRTIKNLPHGQYYWSVQALDNNFAGSKFAQEQIIILPLPVELTSFNASINNTNVILSWETATEVNNYGFEIERKSISTSSKEGDWIKIGFANGHGNSNSPKAYSFTDKNLNGGTIFKYRLKQIDNDGQYEYSKEAEIEIIPNKYILFQNYPNPFNPSTTIKYAIPYGSTVEIIIYNTIGQKVDEFNEGTKDAGYYDVVWEPKNLSSGVYFYSIIAKGKYGKNNYSRTIKMSFMK